MTLNTIHKPIIVNWFHQTKPEEERCEGGRGRQESEEE